MSILETIKATAETALGLVKANPIAAAGIAVGTVVVGYGGYRGVKYIRNRKPAAAALTAAEAITVISEAAAPLAPVEQTAAQIMASSNAALLSMTREEAKDLDVLSDWNIALKAALRARQK